MEKCPHCKGKTGYYVKTRIYGSHNERHNWDGSWGENTDMHESLNYKIGKIKYCQDCHKKIMEDR